MTIERRWLTVEETAEYIGYHKYRVVRMIRDGVLPAVKFGKQTPGPDRREWRVDKQALDRMADEQIEAAS
jgi:excisionase family DNA binding protein